MVTTQGIAWAAGIYEGEGNVQKPTHYNRTQNIQITQKDRWMLDRFKQLFGGSVNFYEYPATTSRPARSFFHYSLTGPAARGFLMTIYMFLSPRRKAQVREALQDRTDLTRRSPFRKVASA